jgi:hypothetical protein
MSKEFFDRDTLTNMFGGSKNFFGDINKTFGNVADIINNPMSKLTGLDSDLWYKLLYLTPAAPLVFSYDVISTMSKLSEFLSEIGEAVSTGGNPLKVSADMIWRKFLEQARGPLEGISKDLVTPGVYYPGGNQDSIQGIISRLGVDTSLGIVAPGMATAFRNGGVTSSDGLAYLHADERVLSPEEYKGMGGERGVRQRINSGSSGNTIIFNFNSGSIFSADENQLDWFVDVLDKKLYERSQLEHG